MNKKVAIILVNWNGKADTLACLKSLGEDQYPHKQIFVVDNDSADDSASALEAAYPEVTLIRAGRNLGFTGGNNLGIRQALDAGADYVFLLNNDTTVEPDAVSQLVRAAERRPEAGLLTPAIYYFDEPEKAWFVGSKLDLKRAVAVHDNTHPVQRDDPEREIPWASGCAMLLPAAVIKQAGGFDERYFLNWEDVDLSLRIRQAGGSIFLVPSARIYHKVGQSMTKTPGPACYYYTRNHLLLLRSHACGNCLLKYVRMLRDDLRPLARARWQNKPNSAVALSSALHGFLDGALGRFGVKHSFWSIGK